jgi:hypothetical protein
MKGQTCSHTTARCPDANINSKAYRKPLRPLLPMTQRRVWPSKLSAHPELLRVRITARGPRPQCEEDVPVSSEASTRSCQGKFNMLADLECHRIRRDPRIVTRWELRDRRISARSGEAVSALKYLARFCSVSPCALLLPPLSGSPPAWFDSCGSAQISISGIAITARLDSQHIHQLPHRRR